MANSPGFQPREIRAIFSIESRRDGGAEFHANTVAPSGLTFENNLFSLPPSLRDESVQLHNSRVGLPFLASVGQSTIEVRIVEPSCDLTSCANPRSTQQSMSCW